MVRSLVATALLAAAAGAIAQETYPARPPQVIVPWTAGGVTDVMARAFLEQLGGALGGPFLVVNRDGAGGTIGFAQLAAARPDGYTLGFGPSTPMANSPHLIRKLPFGFNDFEYVCQVFENVFTVAVAPNSRFHNLRALVDAARATPGKLTFGSAGMTSLPHLIGEGFARESGIQVTHVPFRGDAQVTPALIAGTIDFSISNMGAATKQLRPLAVFGERRHPAIPDVPTVRELGMPDMPPGLQGLYAPKGLPAPLLARLEQGCAQAVGSAAFRSFALRLNSPPAYLDAKTFRARALADHDWKGKLIRSLGIEPQ